MNNTNEGYSSEERSSTSYMLLPKELKAVYIELAEVLREKVQALQDHKYDVAATLRDREQQLRDRIANFKEH
jgi:hypothetical protein